MPRFCGCGTRRPRLGCLLAWGGAKYKVLHNFGSSMDGTVPSGPLLLDEQGQPPYGVTKRRTGREYGYGTSPSSSNSHTNGKWKEAILHAFAAGSDGAILEAD